MSLVPGQEEGCSEAQSIIQEGCRVARGGKVEVQWDGGGEEDEDAAVKLGTTGTM